MFCVARGLRRSDFTCAPGRQEPRRVLRKACRITFTLTHRRIATGGHIFASDVPSKAPGIEYVRE